MRKNNPHFVKRYSDCLELYKELGGRRLTQVERRMREMGHAGFSRRILYGRVERGVYKPGWIDRYDWKKRVERDDPILPDASASVSTRLSSTAHFEVRKTREENDPAAHDPLADTEFQKWLKRVSPGMKWDWAHQRYIYQYLERVNTGECKRLMIFLPPRHGKSELVTVRYTAWRMAQDPKLNVILGSYNQTLANRFSRKVRRVLCESFYLDEQEKKKAENDSGRLEAGSPANVFPSKHLPSHSHVSGKPDSNHSSSDPPSLALLPFRSRPANSLAEWETGQGGGLRAVGVGGGVTGFGASLIVVDDPVKSRAEAESETYRENIYEWFNDDLYTRLEPGGAIVLIQTRWHEDDLAGRLLREMKEGGEQWDVIDLPAIAEERTCDYEPVPEGEQPVVKPDPLGRTNGAALCPERFDIADLEKLRRKLGAYSFAALYQQRPTPLDGGIFKRHWFSKIVSYVPPDVKLTRTYDLAISTKTTADYTVSAIGGYDKAGNLYIVDVYRNRIEYPEQRRFVVNRLKEESSIEHCIELAVHGQALIQDLRREPGIRSTALRGIKVETDKLTRALSWANLAEEGKVILVRGPWNREFLEEVCQFPQSKHDDQVDAVSLLVNAASTKRKYRHAGF